MLVWWSCVALTESALDVTIQKQANATGRAEVVDRDGVGARLGERFAVNDVDRAGGVWGGVVERWRHQAFFEAQERCDQLDRAGSATDVAEVTFQRRDGDLAQDVRDGGCLKVVVFDRAEALGVDVADFDPVGGRFAQAGFSGRFALRCRWLACRGGLRRRSWPWRRYGQRSSHRELQPFHEFRE